MEKKKEIVAHFNEDVTKVLFYTVEDNNDPYTLIRRQGLDTFILYNNKHNLYAELKEFISWDKIDTKQLEWKFDKVFFWADSPFVTRYGYPEYDKLISTYKTLLDLKKADVQNMIQYNKMMETLPFIEKIKMFVYYRTVIKQQERYIKRQLKGLKVIW